MALGKFENQYSMSGLPASEDERKFSRYRDAYLDGVEPCDLDGRFGGGYCHGAYLRLTKTERASGKEARRLGDLGDQSKDIGSIWTMHGGMVSTRKGE